MTRDYTFENKSLLKLVKQLESSSPADLAAIIRLCYEAIRRTVAVAQQKAADAERFASLEGDLNLITPSSLKDEPEG